MRDARTIETEDNGEVCDGTCNCACGWDQEHPYSQRCIPECLLPGWKAPK